MSSPAARSGADAEAFGDRFGLQAEPSRDAGFRTRLQVRPEHQIEHGTFVHGGCLAAMCEQTARHAALRLRPGTWRTGELQLDYLAGASGNELRCDARVAAVARHGVVVDTLVHSVDGTGLRLVASARSTVIDMPSLPAMGTDPSQNGTVDWSPPAMAGTGDWIREDFTQGWRRYCGIRPVAAGHGCIEMQHDVQPHHLGSDGHVLEALIAPFADAAGGACAYTTAHPGERMATLDLALSYLNAGTPARRLLARAGAIKVGRTVVVSRVDVLGCRDDGEQLMATAIVTVTRVPGHQRALQDRAAEHPAPVRIS